MVDCEYVNGPLDGQRFKAEASTIVPGEAYFTPIHGTSESVQYRAGALRKDGTREYNFVGRQAP